MFDLEEFFNFIISYEYGKQQILHIKLWNFEQKFASEIVKMAGTCFSSIDIIYGVEKN